MRFSFQNKGVQAVLDGVIEYLPSHTDVPDIQGTDEHGDEIHRETSYDAPFSALALKLQQTLLLER